MRYKEYNMAKRYLPLYLPSGANICPRPTVLGKYARPRANTKANIVLPCDII